MCSNIQLYIYGATLNSCCLNMMIIKRYSSKPSSDEKREKNKKVVKKKTKTEPMHKMRNPRVKSCLFIFRKN